LHFNLILAFAAYLGMLFQRFVSFPFLLPGVAGFIVRIASGKELSL
jgi:hypothetical protein